MELRDRQKLKRCSASNLIDSVTHVRNRVKVCSIIREYIQDNIGKGNTFNSYRVLCKIDMNKWQHTMILKYIVMIYGVYGCEIRKLLDSLDMQELSSIAVGRYKTIKDKVFYRRKPC